MEVVNPQKRYSGRPSVNASRGPYDRKERSGLGPGMLRYQKLFGELFFIGHFWVIDLNLFIGHRFTFDLQTRVSQA